MALPSLPVGTVAGTSTATSRGFRPAANERMRQIFNSQPLYRQARTGSGIVRLRLAHDMPLACSIGP